MQIQEQDDEIDVLHESETPTIRRYTVEETGGKPRIHVLVDDGLSTQHYASEPLTPSKTREILDKLVEQPTVNRTHRDTRKYFELDVPIGDSILFTSQSDPYPDEPNAVVTRFYEGVDGIRAKITNVTQEDSSVILTVKPLGYDTQYTFTVAPEEYKSLRDADTRRVELTLNRTAHNVSDVSIENEDGVILTDEFSIDSLYPITRYRLTFLNIVVATGIGYYTLFLSFTTLSPIYVVVFVLMFALIAIQFGSSVLKVYNEKDALSKWL